MNLRSTLVCGLLAASAFALPGAALAETPTATNVDFLNMVGQIYTHMDANRDGMVSREEFLREMGTRFDRMDKSGRGMIDRNSIESILRELALRPAPA